MSNKRINYAVDLVLCIDCTGSMHGVLDNVKENATRFPAQLDEALQKQQKKVDQLRVKVIAFRDYYVDGDQSMLETDFFNFPDEVAQYSDFVQQLEPDGGGDEPENGLEALSLAIKSDWTTEGRKQRQVIVMFTDASAHPLEIDKEKPSNYPTDIPKNFNELKALWDNEQTVSKESKRLVLMAPDAYPWTDITTHWELVVSTPSKAGKGLTDIDHETILNTIVNSF